MNLLGLGERIALIRNTKKLTQSRFALATGVSRTAFRNYEAGTRAPSVEFIYALLVEFNINPAFLFFGQEPMFALPDDPINDEAQAYKALAEQRKAEIQQLKAKIAELKQQPDSSIHF